MPRAAALLLVAALLLSTALSVPGASAETLEMGRTVVMRAAAVSESATGYVGSTATISITSAANGSGHVFVDTLPLTQIDMQGSARLAARVAAQLTGKDLHSYDFFFVIRSGAQQIGGPSAGATMTVGAIAALNGWKVRDDVLMTGTINPDATVGPVGGIAEKATAAAQSGVVRFLFPAGQEVVPFGSARIVNMTEYCADELKIECIPASDVVEAVGLMTDHVIERPPISGNVTGADFLARLAPLGAQLVADAQTIVNEANASLTSVPESAAKTGLMERMTNAATLLERARREVVNGTYYTAASTSFQASIDAHFVREASQYLLASDKSAAAQATLAESQATIRRVVGDIDASPVDDTNGFEAVGAAQVRILEAEDRLARARTLLDSPTAATDLFDALYHASYAAERAQTAGWWLQLTEGFPAGESVDREALEGSARDALTTSQEEVTYVEAVFEEAGGAVGAGRSATLLSDARELLDRAETAMGRGYHAGAMLDALEASVRASVALEIAGFGGSAPESKLATAGDNAARAIQGARGRGVESLLGQSAYEFGQSLADPVDRLVFLGMARVTSNLAGLPGLFDAPQAPTTRFQGEAIPYRVGIVYVAAAFAVGIALGVGAGLTALMPRKPEEDDIAAPSTPPEPGWMPPAAIEPQPAPASDPPRE